MAKRDLIAVGSPNEGPVQPQQVPKRIRHALAWATNKLLRTFAREGDWNSNRTYWHNHYAHGLGGSSSTNFYSLPPGAAQALRDQQRLIELYGRAAFAAGVEHGTSILAQLAAGTLTNDKFEEQMKRERKVIDQFDEELLVEVEAQSEGVPEGVKRP